LPFIPLHWLPPHFQVSHNWALWRHGLCSYVLWVQSLASPILAV
jgi:hypothetical protein